MREFSTERIERVVAAEFRRRTGRAIERDWIAVSLPLSAGNWRMWACRSYGGDAGPSRTYKLYISPQAEFFFHTIGVVLRHLTAVRTAYRIKIGRDPYGVLRPDKIVAYFKTAEDLRRSSIVLRQKLAGIPSHGAPFTTDISGDGLLSSGIDPPKIARHVHLERESWRLWITNQLATSLIAAQRGPKSDIQPWQYAVLRIQLDGVDAVSWSPKPGLWSDDV
jgi:hypothetical protein